jgi:hypothetical protein
MKWRRQVIQKEDMSSVGRILLVKCEWKRQFGKTGHRCRIKVKEEEYMNAAFLG